MNKKKVLKDKMSQGYYNVVYKNKVYLEHHPNGSFTLSDDKGNKQTYYGYTQTQAKKKFNEYRRQRK